MTAPTPYIDRKAELFRLYWNYITERRAMELRRRAGEAPPWTADPILRDHRFTNVYRASDRVSQFLIKEVQYTGDQTPEELVFRTLVFKLFNQIGTWQWLCEQLEEQPSLKNWDPWIYSHHLNVYNVRGGKIWNNAYMITPPLKTYGGVKHEGWLDIFDTMWAKGAPRTITNASSLEEVYQTLLRYPTVGKFFAFQWTIDINYSTAIDFDEDTFVVAGPGAVRGVQKCFGTSSGIRPEAAIQLFTAEQDEMLARFGLDLEFLGGSRRLHLVDVQSGFCEFDKYTRVARPELDHASAGYKRIKQSYAPYRAAPLPPAWFPPKWGINR